jgi:hypothetical protein
MALFTIKALFLTNKKFSPIIVKTCEVLQAGFNKVVNCFEEGTKMARTTKAPKTAVAAAAKAPEKKAARKTCKTTVCVEMNGLTADVTAIQNAVKSAVKAQGVEATELKIYINASEKAAYYTVNGEGDATCKIDLAAL